MVVPSARLGRLDETLSDAGSKELLRRHQKEPQERARLAGSMLCRGGRAPIVLGIELTGAETALLDQAHKTGELLLPPWLPASSPLPLLWEKMCARQGRPCCVRLVRPEEPGEQKS